MHLAKYIDFNPLVLAQIVLARIGTSKSFPSLEHTQTFPDNKVNMVNYEKPLACASTIPSLHCTVPQHNNNYLS